MDTYELLQELTEHDGICGFEHSFAELMRQKLCEFCDEVSVNRHRCVTGIIRSGIPDAKKLMLEAHLDRIGLIVTGIDDDGFVSFSTLGGVDERILPASEVYIHGSERVYGIVGAKPPHLLSKSDERTSTKIDDMLIDTGMSGDELRRIVSVGDAIMLKSKLCRLLGRRVASAALDNRAGMAAVFDCIGRIMGEKLPYDVYITFTSGEELGLHGAYTVSMEDKPDFSIVVDVTHGTTPDSPEYAAFPLGSGAVICRGPNLHYDVTNRIIAFAKENKIPYDIEVAGGSSGTNAWALQTLGGGIPCALISIPLRYMHTSVEVVDMCDIENVGKLLAGIACGGVELA